MDTLDGVVLEVISPEQQKSPLRKDGDTGDDNVEANFRKFSLAKNILTLTSDDQSSIVPSVPKKKSVSAASLEVETGWTTEDVLRQRRQYGWNEIVTKKPSKLKRIAKVSVI